VDVNTSWITGNYHMPIRMIAKELYSLLKEVEKIEKQFNNAPFEKQDEIKDKLRKKKAELNRMRAVLEGKKDHKLKHPIK
jgi:ElaB/YqjD/DUF883 family membrane-anchored ribosome-binding protein